MHRYNDYGSWLQRQLPFKVQKIAVDAGFTCPNRDGTKGVGGCTYCDNGAFSPAYCDRRKSVSAQIVAGKQFFKHKFSGSHYLVYFQSFSNTYAPVERLRQLYEEALASQGVVGLVIATRPDCVNEGVLDLLEEISHHTFVTVEYGIESTSDRTLRSINRGHNFKTAVEAIEETHRRGIFTAAHVILGLPGETHEDMIQQAIKMSETKIDILKIHQLQVIKGTVMAQEYAIHPFHTFTHEEYIALLAEYIRYLRPEIALERFVSVSPSGMVIAPKWGIKSSQFEHLFDVYLEEKGYRQGDLA